MNMLRTIGGWAACCLPLWVQAQTPVPAPVQSDTLWVTDFGASPDSRQNTSALMPRILQAVKDHPRRPLVVAFPKGRYDFYEADAAKREYYISNHDQEQPKRVGMALEHLADVVIDGQGSEFVFHGRMLPLSLLGSEGCTLKDFSIDFEVPHIAQVKVLEQRQEGLLLEIPAWVPYEIAGGRLYFHGPGWRYSPFTGIAFEEKSKRLVYRTSDLSIPLGDVQELQPGRVLAKGWKDERLKPGTAVALRSYYRPAPGIFLSENRDTRLERVKVHYAEGMGLLAQLCENISLDGFSVCLKGADDPRYFTTQADATHFSSCKGTIRSAGGLYEGMMDDAINVHGTYLKVLRRLDDHTLEAAYMHPQAFGFAWGYPGDSVQFVQSTRMEVQGAPNVLKAIHPVDKPQVQGAKVFRLSLVQALPQQLQPETSFGIENLSWTPEVYFENNVVRNNRARGSLFSTPRRTVVAGNFFDHTSGTAVLLCGDCNGWFETGACRQVEIKGNTFRNALTNEFQFTSAIISIYPEIPDLKGQQRYFHSGIRIEDNVFETFDRHLIYAKSVDGLLFKGNKVRYNQDYPAYHWNTQPFLLERVRNLRIEGNDLGRPFSRSQDVKVLQ